MPRGVYKDPKVVYYNYIERILPQMTTLTDLQTVSFELNTIIDCFGLDDLEVTEQVQDLADDATSALAGNAHLVDGLTPAQREGEWDRLFKAIEAITPELQKQLDELDEA